MFSISYGQSWLNDYQDILSKYVTSDGVKYKKLKAKGTAQLDQVIQAITSETPSGSDADKLAYYINAYNAWMIKTVVDHYPTDNLLANNSKLFDEKRIKVDGKQMSFNDLEHGIIRERYKEARIHFVVNCGAESCPPISKTAFTGTNLYDELHKQTVNFINSKQGVDQKGESLNVSKLFEWYAKDFKAASPNGTVLGYIKKYKKLSGNPALSFQEYSWQINED